MQAPDKQFSEEQSRQIAAMIREELARRRISRQHLADEAKLSISTLEKALSYVEDDEFVEVTPTAIRLRKRYLDPNERKRFERKIDADAAD